MNFVARDPDRHGGRVVHNGQCVRYVQEACAAPHTSQWRVGAKVRGAVLPRGTAIACFDPDGRYGNHTDGRSHAAIYLYQTDEGLAVLDQWVGHPVAGRTIRFRGGNGRRVNDGDQFHVIETDEPV